VEAFLMADINEQILRQLQELTNTVKSSRVLNGGFEQLEAKVDNFSNQLDDIEKKMDAIQEPEKGLYARVKDLEAWQAITSKVLWGLGASVGSIIMMYLGHKFGVN
jgi:predicted nuclease with TOPRIM domain